MCGERQTRANSKKVDFRIILLLAPCAFDVNFAHNFGRKRNLCEFQSSCLRHFLRKLTKILRERLVLKTHLPVINKVAFNLRPRPTRTRETIISPFGGRLIHAALSLRAST